MKLTLLMSCMISAFVLFGQQEIKPYQLLAKSPDFSKQERLDAIAPMFFDLYRSKTVDNTVIVDVDGQEVTIVLLSAEKLKNLGQPYDAGLVEKGALISGEKANQPRTFVWRVGEGSAIEDLTSY